jgi:Cu/Ag efflux protein CusF
MRSFKPLIVCLGIAVAVPTVAEGPKGDYSALRPKSEMETAPAALGEGVLVQMTGTIADVDMASRLVTIKGPEGGMVTVQAGPEVKNLGEVKKGDKVSVSYYKAIAVDVIVPGTAPKSGSETAMVRAEPGAKPGGAVGRQTRRTVKIASVDPIKKAISFYGADGRWREVSMDRPDLEHYLSEIKDGDTVEVVYTEALAASITAP